MEMNPRSQKRGLGTRLRTARDASAYFAEDAGCGFVRFFNSRSQKRDLVVPGPIGKNHQMGVFY